MPSLAKGGQWVYGWVVVRPQGKVTIPLEAQLAYGFRVGDEELLLPGSRRSGRFSLGTPTQISPSLRKRVLGQSRIGEGGQVMVPTEADVRPGDRLLALRGSRYALGLVARGPIYQAAAQHPALEVF